MFDSAQVHSFFKFAFKWIKDNLKKSKIYKTFAFRLNYIVFFTFSVRNLVPYKYYKYHKKTVVKEINNRLIRWQQTGDRI